MTTPTRREPRGLLGSRFARALALAMVVAGMVLVLAEWGYHKHPYFGFDGLFGLYPLVGFTSVVGAVVIARLLRPMLGRHENYYGEAEPEPEPGTLDDTGRAHD